MSLAFFNEAEREVLRPILQRAAVDPGFRQRLLRHPKETISGASGVELPGELVVRFIEKEREVDFLIVLPDLVEDDSLSDAALEAVHGGALRCDGVDGVLMVSRTWDERGP